jgi:hypothetical protein
MALASRQISGIESFSNSRRRNRPTRYKGGTGLGLAIMLSPGQG